jgi:hypothetical protein
MTEQEIVNVLKENKNKGIAYLFLSEDVWEWIGENFNNPKLLYLAPNGKWELFSETDFDDYDNVVLALPDDYEVKQESKGEWVEFEIDQKGNFHCFMNGDMHYFFWANWNAFLTEADSSGYTTFGGWQYEGSKRWYLAPAVKLQDGEMWNSYVIEQSGEATPVAPVKIRFWREAK